jgi:hypothetical protein
LYALVGKRRAGDVPAQLPQRLPIVGRAAHGGVQAEPVDVSAKAGTLRVAAAPSVARQGQRGLVTHLLKRKA